MENQKHFCPLSLINSPDTPRECIGSDCAWAYTPPSGRVLCAVKDIALNGH